MDLTWFNYPITVFPHQTDYGGVAWHGTYLAWLEEARVACLDSIGVSFSDFVSSGCDMQVVDISLQPKRSLRLGDKIIVKARVETERIRIIWRYEIRSIDSNVLYTTATITLVAVDISKQKIMRQLPPAVQSALDKLLAI